MEIQAGEGGEDSRLFVHDLFAAYVKYAVSLDLKTEIIDSTESNVKAIIKGAGAGRAFQHEPGKHVCQRVPPTESKGRRHTSIVSVAVLPLQKKSEVSISDEDLLIEPVNLGGKGGQHSNRTLSGCRITHKPTGLQAVVNGRKYHSNERKARQIIVEKVNATKKAKAKAKQSANKQEQMQGGTRSGKVRTYNFIKSVVNDHRLGKKTRNIQAVMKGDFSKILG